MKLKMKKTLNKAVFGITAVVVIAIVIAVSIPQQVPEQDFRVETIIENFTVNHGWTNTGTGTSSDDTIDFIVGDRSLKLIGLSDSSQDLLSSGVITPTIDMTGKVFVVYMKVSSDRPSEYSGFDFGASSDNFVTNFYGWKLQLDPDQLFEPDTWQRMTFVFNENYRNMFVTGSPDRTEINALRIAVTDVATAHTIHLGKIETQDEGKRGACVISFDDTHDGTFDFALPVMSQYGIKGTNYIIPKQVGKADKQTLEQLFELQNIHGWDVSGHHQTNLNNLDGTEINNVLSSVKQYLIDNGFQIGADHFAYPGGYWNKEILEIASRYFKTGRGIGDMDETFPPKDWMNMRSNIIAATDTPSNLAGFCKKSEENNSLNILVFHDIVANGASGSLEYNDADFQQFIEWVAGNGTRVMTMSEAYRYGSS